MRFRRNSVGITCWSSARNGFLGREWCAGICKVTTSELVFTVKFCGQVLCDSGLSVIKKLVTKAGVRRSCGGVGVDDFHTIRVHHGKVGEHCIDSLTQRAVGKEHAQYRVEQVGSGSRLGGGGSLLLLFHGSHVLSCERNEVGSACLTHEREDARRDRLSPGAHGVDRLRKRLVERAAPELMVVDVAVGVGGAAMGLFRESAVAADVLVNLAGQVIVMEPQRDVCPRDGSTARDLCYPLLLCDGEGDLFACIVLVQRKRPVLLLIGRPLLSVLAHFKGKEK